jgi:hypothetical protein
MATQLLTRKERGDMIAPEDIEQINPDSFFVRSQTRKSGYSVTRTGQSWACDCFDFRYRQMPCKHVHAVLTLLEQRRIGFRYKVGLW